MSQEGVNVWTSLPIKNNAFSANDRVLFLYGVDTGNPGTANSQAQTASISLTNLFGNSAFAFSFANLVANNLTVNNALFLPNLPTANPHVNNQIWSNSGVLMVSSG